MERGHRQKIRTLTGHAQVYSADGTTLASAGDDKVRLWDVATGDTVRTLTDVVVPLAFSPDGTTLASGGGDSQIRLWSLQ